MSETIIGDPKEWRLGFRTRTGKDIAKVTDVFLFHRTTKEEININHILLGMNVEIGPKGTIAMLNLISPVSFDNEEPTNILTAVKN